jgi:hypothetical protein
VAEEVVAESLASGDAPSVVAFDKQIHKFNRLPA